MSAERLKSAVQISALIRQTESVGGSAMVLAKGDADRGQIIVIAAKKGVICAVWERVLGRDGLYQWTRGFAQDIENKQSFDDSLARRRKFDPDLWIIELDIPDQTQLTAVLAAIG